jgi:hypothetical protein
MMMVLIQFVIGRTMLFPSHNFESPARRRLRHLNQRSGPRSVGWALVVVALMEPPTT